MPGVWKRSGQMATIVGLDWPAALALIPPHCDRERVVASLGAWEGGMLKGQANVREVEQARAAARAEAGGGT